MCEEPTGKWKQEKTEHKEGSIEFLDIDLGELPFWEKGEHDVQCRTEIQIL